MNEELKRIGEHLRRQDNLSTADPIFLVQAKRRVYGIDTGYDPNIAWLHSDEAVEVSPEDAVKLEAVFRGGPKDPELDMDGYRRVGYVDEWEFVSCFFTASAAQRYIDSNKHRHPSGLQIYVDSAYRNYEWMAIRKWLTEAPPPPLRAFACRLKNSETDWGKASGYNARSEEHAKRRYLSRVSDLYPDTKYEDVECREIGEPVTSEEFLRTARMRQLPEWVRCGTRVLSNRQGGVIVGHNDSANLDVLLDTGRVGNVHPGECEFVLPKEQIYDEQIAPLMTQIIAICKEHKIAMVSSFDRGQDDTDRDLLCSTVLTEEEFDPPDVFKEIVKLLCPSAPKSITKITARDAGGQIIRQEVIL